MKPTRYYSNKQEKKVAKLLGGKTTPNSGATAFSKGDVVTDLFLIECKTKTDNSASLKIKREWLIKLKEEAFAMHRPYYALAFDFGDDERHYIIDEKLFKCLLEYVEEG